MTIDPLLWKEAGVKPSQMYKILALYTEQEIAQHLVSIKNVRILAKRRNELRNEIKLRSRNFRISDIENKTDAEIDTLISDEQTDIDNLVNEMVANEQELKSYIREQIPRVLKRIMCFGESKYGKKG